MMKDDTANTNTSNNFQDRNERNKNGGIKFHIGIVGGRGDSGWRNVQDDCMNYLLRSKIVVTAQKDRWEDHYRLMEALFFGALVFMDPMVGKMPHGLTNEVSVLLTTRTRTRTVRYCVLWSSCRTRLSS